MRPPNRHPNIKIDTGLLHALHTPVSESLKNLKQRTVGTTQGTVEEYCQIILLKNTVKAVQGTVGTIQ
jgi:hypothetical protein